MRSKTSFFNKSLFLSDIKRYWWIAAAYTLLLIFACAVPLYESCAMQYGYASLKNLWLSTPGFAINFVFTLGVGTIIWTFMHFNNSVSSFHSMPMTRMEIYITKVLSSMLLLVLPLAVLTVILTVMSLTPECRPYFETVDAIEWLYHGIVYTIIIFSLTTIVNMMTGNPIGTIVFTIGFMILPSLLVSFSELLFEKEVYGYSSYYASEFLSNLYIGPDGLSSLRYCFIYPVLSALFFAGGYILYKYRKSESNGEVITFGWLVPVFIGVIACLASILSYVYFYGFMQIESIFTLIPFGIIGTAVAYMIAKKTLRPRGILKPIAIYTACILCFIGILQFDISGYEKRIPDIEDIEGATISSWEFHQDGKLPVMFSSENDLTAMTNLHKHLIETEDLRKNTYNQTSIIYHLKNGKVMERRYSIVDKYDRAFLEVLYETDAYKKSRYTLLGAQELDIVSVEIADRRIETEIFETLYPDNKNMNKLINAITEDMKNASYTDIAATYDTSTRITISWNERLRDYKKDVKIVESEVYTVTPNSVNTIKILKKMGFYKLIPDAGDIESTMLTLTSDSGLKEAIEVKLTDTNEIAEVYGEYDDMIAGYNFDDYHDPDNTDVSIAYTLKNGHTFIVQATYSKDKLPDAFKKYMK